MFMADISTIVRKMRIHGERNQATLGVGFPEQLALMHLKAHGSCNQEAIACALNVDKGAIAKTIARLEEKQLVERQVNESNKREKLVTLLPAADHVLQDMQSSYKAFEDAMFAGLTDKQRQQLVQSIALVAANIAEI